MPKRKKEAKGEGSAPALAPVNASSKDIDEIFSKRAASKPAVPKPPKQSIIAQEAVPSTATVPVANELANVQKKVTAARAAKSTLISNASVNDDFADIRGTKKRSVQLE